MTSWADLTQADWQRLVRVARRVSAQDPEDAVQAACLRVWLSGKWAGHAGLTTYLHHAVRSEAINAALARRAQKRGGGRVPEPVAELPSAADPLQAVQYWRKCLAHRAALPRSVARA